MTSVDVIVVGAGPTGLMPATAMLTRPDGHVCRTSGPEPLETALRAWFGAPG